MSKKRCPDCGAEKSLDDLPRNATRSDGRGLYCRDCFAVRYRAHRERKAAAQGRQIRERRVTPVGMKWCPRCQVFKDLDDFGRNRSSRDGRTAYCRRCHNEVGRESKQRLYGGTRDYHLMRRYGITGADVEAMIAAQGGTCAVCSGKPEHVDHDHPTGRIRGVLCFNCNQALGNVRDDPDVLYRLVGYLATHGRDAADPPRPLVVDIYHHRGDPTEFGGYRHPA